MLLNGIGSNRDSTKYLKSISKMDVQDLYNLQEAYLEIYNEDYRDLPVGKLMRKAHNLGKQSGMQHLKSKQLESRPSLIGKLTNAKSRSKELKNKSERASNRSWWMSAVASEHDPDVSIEKSERNKLRGANRAKSNIRKFNREDMDLYDTILSYLLDEGYADTEHQAFKIMVNMSEDWKNKITNLAA
jgi:hypothetical protein